MTPLGPREQEAPHRAAVPPMPRRELRAGSMSARLEAGNLRYIRLHGVELPRAVAFAVQPCAWGSCVATIHELEIEEPPDSFVVTCRARRHGPGATLSATSRIEGHADGRLRFAAAMIANLSPLTQKGDAGDLAPFEVRFKDLVAASRRIF